MSYILCACILRSLHCLRVLVDLFAYMYISVLLQWSLSRYTRFKSLSIRGPTLCEQCCTPFPLQREEEK